MLRLAFTFLSLIPLCCAQDAPTIQRIREVEVPHAAAPQGGVSATTATTPVQLQFSTHNIAPGSGAQNKLIAVDSAGNFFVVSTLSPKGRTSPVHVTKTDSAGNVLAVFDFGGSGFTTPVAAIVDGSGGLLIGGTTASTDFPLVSALQTTGVAFLTRLDSGLTKIVYSTRLGAPAAASSVNAIALDHAGNIYVAGNTGPGLPVSSNAFQTEAPAGSTAQAYGFVAEISPDGSQQLFSTYYTGSLHIPPPAGLPCFFVCVYMPPLETLPNAIAVDAEGNVIIAGTTSDAIPVTSGAFAQQCNCGPGLGLDGFVAKLSAGGTALEWGTYLPLSDPSAYAAPGYYGMGVSVQAIALDSSGNVVLAGHAPTSFPTTAGALQVSFPAAPPPADGVIISPQAGFVATLDSTGSKLVHSTYFGGSLIGYGPYSGVAGLALDGAGTIWITGGSSTAALPPGSEPALGQNYIAALSPDLSALSTLYTVPDGGAGVAIALGPQSGIASVGSGAALLIGQPGTGPSIMGVAPSVAYGVSDLTVPYELISIYGLSIGPATGLQAQISDGIISRSLGGVQVLFDGSPAALLYAGPNQINAIVPSNTGTIAPTTAVEILTPSGMLAGPALAVQRLMPGVFTNRGGFPTPAVNQDGTINSASNPAPFGSIVAVFLTGIGSSAGGDDMINFEQSSNLAVSVLGPSCIGGLRSVEVTYAGSAPQSPPGVSQVNFVLPDQKCNGANYMSFEGYFSQYSENAVASGSFNIYVK